MILFGSGQRLHYEDIKEAAILQFPEHRAAPYTTQYREFDKGNRRDGAQQPPRDTRPQQLKGNGKGNGKTGNLKTGKGSDGKGKGNSYVRTSYLAEARRKLKNSCKTKSMNPTLMVKIMKNQPKETRHLLNRKKM